MVIISICTQGVSTLAWTWTPTQAGHMKAPSRTILRAQKKHSQSQEKIETFKSLESWASENLLPLAKPVEKSWQPRDFLPDSSLTSDEFIDQVKCLRERTKELPDDYLVVLVGSMITEEALPTYQSWMNKHDGVDDETGACNTPWATWTRSWTAEENRHGDLLKTYLYLSGRVDMHMIEKTIQYLIGAGMDVGTEQDPYMGFVYTSFQERATYVSHGSLARLAKKGGDSTLARICGTITADEKRHEIAYERVVEKLLEVDPTETMIAIERMLRRNIKMPSHLMHDGHDPCLFNNFSVVAQRIGVYTVNDYINIIEFLIGRWRLEKLEGLTSEGKHAQEIVCGLPRKIGRLHERADERVRKINPKFSWIYDRELSF